MKKLWIWNACDRRLVNGYYVEMGALRKRYKYVILVPSGAKGAYIDNLSRVKGQFEFLLDYRCQYRLVAKSGRTVHLEVIV